MLRAFICCTKHLCWCFHGFPNMQILCLVYVEKKTRNAAVARCFMPLYISLSHSRLLKVIGNGTIRQIAYEFLLVKKVWGYDYSFWHNTRTWRTLSLRGWLRGTVGRTSVFDRRTFPILRSTCSWWVTTYVGKPSAVGQPTRPTQPFILSG